MRRVAILTIHRRNLRSYGVLFHIGYISSLVSQFQIVDWPIDHIQSIVTYLASHERITSIAPSFLVISSCFHISHRSLFPNIIEISIDSKAQIMSIRSGLTLIILSALPTWAGVTGNSCSWNSHGGNCVQMDSNGHNVACNNANGFLVTEICQDQYGDSFADVLTQVASF